MAGNLEKVIACFRELGLKPDVQRFEDRLVAQKTVYLLDRLGVKTGFPFGMYVRGPYSPALTKQLYAEPNAVKRLETSCKLNKRELDAVHKLREGIELKPAQLEIVSTYACLAEDEGLDADDALRELKRLKPFYSAADVAVGVSRAKGLFFKPTKADLRSLREENAGWERLSDEAWNKME